MKKLSLVVSLVIGGLVGQNAYSNYYADDAAIKKNMLNENVFSENNADWL